VTCIDSPKRPPEIVGSQQELEVVAPPAISWTPG
jgi:hypothetical protein